MIEPDYYYQKYAVLNKNGKLVLLTDSLQFAKEIDKQTQFISNFMMNGKTTTLAK